MRVYRIHVFFVDDVKWEAMFVTIPRSFKLDVWASAITQDATELVYQGRFEPSFFQDEQELYAQVEDYVRSKH